MAPISSYTEKQVRDLIKTSESGMPYPDSTTQSTKNLTVDPTGPDIHYLGNRAYAYSGSVSVDNTETTILDFTTNSETIKGKIEFCYSDNFSPNAVFRVKLNDQTIWDFEADHSQLLTRGQSGSLRVIIPPFTHVVCTGQNDTDATAIPLMIVLTGKVYEP